MSKEFIPSAGVNSKINSLKKKYLSKDGFSKSALKKMKGGKESLPPPIIQSNGKLKENNILKK